MNVLAIETSSAALCIGLKIQDEVFEHFDVIGRRHNDEVLPEIDELLRTHGLSTGNIDLLVYGRGPGSFTGVRIAVGIAQGLGFGWQIPTVGISSLAILAQTVSRQQQSAHILTALQAREAEVYWGRYELVSGIVEPAEIERVVDVKDLAPLEASGPWIGVGSGWQHRELIEESLNISVEDVVLDIYPRAEDLMVLGCAAYERGEAITAENAQPVYLREQVAQKPRQVK